MIDFIQNTLDGIFVGSSYALLAIGFTLIFGIMRRLNLSYGPVDHGWHLRRHAGLCGDSSGSCSGRARDRCSCDPGRALCRAIVLQIDQARCRACLHGLELCDLDATGGDRHRPVSRAYLCVSRTWRVHADLRPVLRTRRARCDVLLRSCRRGNRFSDLCFTARASGLPCGRSRKILWRRVSWASTPA